MRSGSPSDASESEQGVDIAAWLDSYSMTLSTALAERSDAAGAESYRSILSTELLSAPPNCRAVVLRLLELQDGYELWPSHLSDTASIERLDDSVVAEVRNLRDGYLNRRRLAFAGLCVALVVLAASAALWMWAVTDYSAHTSAAWLGIFLTLGALALATVLAAMYSSHSRSVWRVTLVIVPTFAVAVAALWVLFLADSNVAQASASLSLAAVLVLVAVLLASSAPLSRSTSILTSGLIPFPSSRGVGRPTTRVPGAPGAPAGPLGATGEGGGNDIAPIPVVGAELSRLSLLARTRAEDERLRARRWGLTLYLLGGAAAMTSATAAAAAGFGDPQPWYVAPLALAAGGLAAVSTALNPGKQKETADSLAIGFESLAYESDILTRVDLGNYLPSLRREALDDLLTRFESLSGASDLNTFWKRNKTTPTSSA